MREPIRVLHVLGGTGLGGAESRIMDLYRCMDPDRVQFDFAVHGDKKGYFDDEIERLGGRIYHLPKFRGYNLLSYRKAWTRFFAEHPGYRCVQGHMTSTASLYLPCARRAGVAMIAAHARSAGVDRGPKGWLTRLLRLPLAKRADYCLATSALAGEAVFGKRAVRKKRVRVLPNAIMAEKYDFDPAARERIRSSLGLTQNLVLGHVGRFHPLKNHAFLLEIFAQVCQLRPDSVLLLLGEGELMGQIRQKAEALGITDRVRFLGNHSDVEAYYQAMDGFVMPSFYEGLPGVALEAQAAGLPCLLSEEIAKEVAVTDLVTFMSLQRPPKEWAAWLTAHCPTKRRGRVQELRDAGFDTKRQAEAMMAFYETGTGQVLE